MRIIRGLGLLLLSGFAVIFSLFLELGRLLGVVGITSEACLPRHLLTLLGRSLSVLGGFLDQLITVLVVRLRVHLGVGLPG